MSTTIDNEEYPLEYNGWKSRGVDNEQLDAIFLNFAKRIEIIPRGKTYGWEKEKAAIEVLLQQRELEARIDGVEETHKMMMGIANTYRGEDDEMLNFVDFDDLSRVSMNWKLNRIAQLQGLSPKKEEDGA